MLSFATLPEVILLAQAVIPAWVVHASAIVETRITSIRFTFVHIVLTLRTEPLLGAQAFRLPVEQPLARCIVPAVRLRAQIDLAPLPVEAQLALTFRIGILHVQMRTPQEARAVVLTRMQRAKAGAVEQFQAIVADEVTRAIAPIAIDQVRAGAIVCARRRGALVDVRFATERKRNMKRSLADGCVRAGRLTIVL